jgi:hypothetical protein
MRRRGVEMRTQIGWVWYLQNGCPIQSRGNAQISHRFDETTSELHLSLD